MPDQPPSYILPSDTMRALAAMPRGAAVANLSLYLNRYVEFDHVSDEYKLNAEAKGYKYANLEYYSAGPGKELLDACAQRQRETLQAAGAEARTSHPGTRCIVGLGAKGAREVGIRLHHLYGFPIIPGSALKGLARAAAIVAIFYALRDKKVIIHPLRKGINKETGKEEFWGALQSLELHIESYQREGKERWQALDDFYGPADDKAELNRWREDKLVWQFRHIFGVQDRAGDGIFFDAQPEALPEKGGLEVDIMNPHYPTYYNSKGKKSPPADYDSPIPIYFLTVGKDSSFVFGVASRSHSDKAKEQAWKWLQAGLETMGVGAKTTSGYGVFTNFQKV